MPPAGATRGVKGTTPIKHVVIVIQENRSFDDFFATFPGANGTTVGEAIPMPSPIASSCAAKGQPVITQATTVPLTEVSLTGEGFPTIPPHGDPFGWDNDVPHVYPSGYLGECNSADWWHPSASNPCQMNGFDVTLFGANGEGPQATCTYTYQYVNPQQIQPYWEMAEQYVLADAAFQTQGSESFTAHQDLIAAGTALSSSPPESIIDDPTGFPWGCDAQPPSPPSQEGSVTTLITTSGQYLLDRGPFPCFTYETIRDLLDAKQVSWKFYADKVYPWHSAKNDSPGIWSAFDAIKAVRYSKEWGTNVTTSINGDLDIFKDITAKTLPSVCWVTPDAADSDHPDEVNKKDQPVDTGPSWVASVVNAIGKSEYWDSTAIIVLWDDWGGFYDHVPPPFYDNQGGLGFRIPLIIVSAYVQPHVEHTQYETASVLKFLEDNWNLGSLGREDQRATSLGNAFDFTQTPRPFQAIPAKYPLSFFLHKKPSGVPPDSE
ncbi:MAG TPA: alkaline phosphatase family protein [Candidatus Babeliales bacterium]|nr:alkaline phosphatase family protein [Candidatus Babeliales bacterium]